MSLADWLASLGYTANTAVLVPDFDYAWSQFVKSTTYKIASGIPFTDLAEEICSPYSICKALLTPNDFDFENNDILYLYNVSVDIPLCLKRRLLVFTSVVLLTPNSDGYNLWELTDDDLSMLTLYKSYYQGNTIALPEFSSLSSNLAKLIHINLDLLINKNAANLANESMSNDTLLCKAYEIKVRYILYEMLLNKEEVQLNG